MNACVLVPCYEHGATLAEVLAGMEPLGLPMLVVDDGSGPESAAAIARARKRWPQLHVVRHERNLGRGSAMRTGYRHALHQGFSHALQLDADAQHDPADAPRFLEAASRQPQALILGTPVFDASVPRARLWGRWLSKVWVWIETRSFAIDDPLCGYRCMPLQETVALLDDEPCGDHMQFDPELAVRLVWQGLEVVNVPTRVRYPAGGISHFDMWRDNVRISRTHARLFFLSLRRSLGLPVRRRQIAR